MNDEDDDGGGNDGNFTDRSDGIGKGPPTQWRLARHGKIKDLEAILTTGDCPSCMAVIVNSCLFVRLHMFGEMTGALEFMGAILSSCTMMWLTNRVPLSRECG